MICRRRTPGSPANRIALSGLLAIIGQAALLAQAPPFASGPPVLRQQPIPIFPAGPAQDYQVLGAVKGVVAKLKLIYAGRTDVQFSEASGKLLVVGPESIHQEVSQWLASEGLLPPPTPPAIKPVIYTEPQTVQTQVWQFKNLSARDFENKLAKTWGTSLQSSQDTAGDVATFRFPPSAGGSTSIIVDRRANTASISSPPASAASWQRLMSVLDSRPRSASEKTAIVPVSKSDPATLRRAVSLLTQIFGGGESRRKQHIGQFVSMLFQPDAGPAAQLAQQPPAQLAQQPVAQVAQQPAAPAPAAAPPVVAPSAPAGGGDVTSQAIAPSAASAQSMEALARINNVQIEILEDVIVVRGRKEDVDRVLQIIEQIESQSLQFKPEMEIYYLKHIDSTALSDMITTVYNAAFGRFGLVTVTPLQRPNAILLIGRKENIPAIIELISKLDVPAPTEGEFKIFRLQNMSAIDAERTVRAFFIARPPTTQDFRPGLGTRALVIADYRSNSLLVQAAPRDMIEVAKIIESLDVPTSTITYEVRVFKLRNSIAETLGPVLEEALTAATATQTAQAVQGQAQATPPRATPPAINLQFLRNSPEGQRMIQSGIMSNIRISADIRTNSLIIVGPSSAMDLIAALVDQLDKLPASEAQIKVFGLKNADATAIADMLTNLFGQPQQANQQAPGQVTATGAGESAIVPLRFSVDQRTNSIIASGNAGDLNVIYAILTRLDEGDVRQRETKVYRLRNAPAADVSNALTQMLQQQLQIIQASPELVTPVEQIEQQVIVVPEVVTNSLIIYATSKQMKRVDMILENLDRRPPMVVIQAVLAEVTLTDNEAFGVEWGLQDALMFDRSTSAAANRFNFNSNPLTLPNDATAGSLATATKVATQGVSNLALGRTDLTQGFGGLVLSASSESVSVLLRALERSQRSQIISRPQVQTMDNQTAFVQVGAKVPRIIGATNTGLTVTPIINDINVGIIMQVTPRVSPDGAIVMQIYTEKSVVGSDATGIPIAVDANGNAIRSPQIPITTAQTIVLARTGQTVILGGLITKDLEEDSHRIPYLADIPVLGRLFRYDQVSNKRTELLIILTPYLVTSPDQIDWINAREGQRMSWCLADLVNIHGPVPFSGNPMFNSSPTPLIFPDIDPNGYPSGPDPYGSVPSFGPPGVVPQPTLQPLNVPSSTGFPSGPAPYSSPGSPTPATPMPVPPGPPVGVGVPPPPPSPGMGYQDPSPSNNYTVPQPPSLMPPAASSSPLGPPSIEPVSPPAGTARRLLPGPQPATLPFATPVAPAQYQQPASQ
ncbi:MAG TPA: secretin N-terminal domain-containing protein [Pirellulaceae bacterium]|jgi:type II secretion system protein D